MLSNILIRLDKSLPKGIIFKVRSKYNEEMKNILERWILSLSNDKVDVSQDIIFSDIKLNYKYPATEKMLSEFNNKKIPDSENKFNYVISTTKKWLSDVNRNMNMDKNFKLHINTYENTIVINDYTRELPLGKLQILLDINPSLEILGMMIMRYACLLIGGQQWALPRELHRYLVEQFNVTVEGFASPVNSQILTISKDLNYCSLFYDTDKFYGSLGDFFTTNFINKNVYANPPYVLSIMDATAEKIIEECSNIVGTNNFVRFFITVPEWNNPIPLYYSKFMESEFLVFDRSFAREKHYYVNTNNGSEKIPSQFGTHLFVLAVGINDTKETYQRFVDFAENIYNMG
jgi:hypothetical protein